MDLQTLKDLYIHELKDLYSAEQQLVKALPKMAKAATEVHLAVGFKEHLEQTKEHAQRLEKILSSHQSSTHGPRNKSMEGIVAEGAELIEEEADDEVRDAGLIAAAQRFEHYEMAGYGTARTYAELLGDKQGASLLKTTLEETKATKERLTTLGHYILEQKLTGRPRAEKADLRFNTLIDPGSASSVEIAEVIEAISKLDRAFGGEGIVSIESSQEREIPVELTRAGLGIDSQHRERISDK